MSKKKIELDREDCGCSHDGSHWTLCVKHQTEYNAFKAEVMADHRRTDRKPSIALEGQEDWGL